MAYFNKILAQPINATCIIEHSSLQMQKHIRKQYDHIGVASVRENVWGNSKNVKSHVFLDFEKKRKKRTGRPTQPVVSQAT